MKDFNLKIYTETLNSIIRQKYRIVTFGKYMDKPYGRMVILRHDIDKLPNNSLAIAEIENNLHINSTYFFRTVPRVGDLPIV